MTEKKSGQGMQRPSLGGIGSRFDVGVAAQVCKHGSTFLWRLDADSKVICGVCHPPAVRVYELVAGNPIPREESVA